MQKKDRNNKLRHVLSIIFILFTAVLAVATSKSKPTFENRLSYEIIGEYLVIKIKTVSEPENYELEDYGSGNGFFLNFKRRRELQRFIKYADYYETHIELSKSNDRNTEKIPLEEQVFETFCEGEYFIVKVKKEYIRYDNVEITRFYLYNKKKFLNGDFSAYEIYK